MNAASAFQSMSTDDRMRYMYCISTADGSPLGLDKNPSAKDVLRAILGSDAENISRELSRRIRAQYGFTKMPNGSFRPNGKFKKRYGFVPDLSDFCDFGRCYYQYMENNDSLNTYGMPFYRFLSDRYGVHVEPVYDKDDFKDEKDYDNYRQTVRAAKSGTHTQRTSTQQTQYNPGYTTGGAWDYTDHEPHPEDWKFTGGNAARKYAERINGSSTGSSGGSGGSRTSGSGGSFGGSNDFSVSSGSSGGSDMFSGFIGVIVFIMLIYVVFHVLSGGSLLSGIGTAVSFPFRLLWQAVKWIARLMWSHKIISCIVLGIAGIIGIVADD